MTTNPKSIKNPESKNLQYIPKLPEHIVSNISEKQLIYRKIPPITNKTIPITIISYQLHAFVNPSEKKKEREWDKNPELSIYSAFVLLNLSYLSSDNYRAEWSPNYANNQATTPPNTSKNIAIPFMNGNTGTASVINTRNAVQPTICHFADHSSVTSFCIGKLSNAIAVDNDMNTKANIPANTILISISCSYLSFFPFWVVQNKYLQKAEIQDNSQKLFGRNSLFLFGYLVLGTYSRVLKFKEQNAYHLPLHELPEYVLQTVCHYSFYSFCVIIGDSIAFLLLSFFIILFLKNHNKNVTMVTQMGDYPSIEITLFVLLLVFSKWIISLPLIQFFKDRNILSPVTSQLGAHLN
jgi:hypothetical protein